MSCSGPLRSRRICKPQLSQTLLLLPFQRAAVFAPCIECAHPICILNPLETAPLKTELASLRFLSSFQLPQSRIGIHYIDQYI